MLFYHPRILPQEFYEQHVLHVLHWRFSIHIHDGHVKFSDLNINEFFDIQILPVHSLENVKCASNLQPDNFHEQSTFVFCTIPVTDIK